MTTVQKLLLMRIVSYNEIVTFELRFKVLSFDVKNVQVE